MKRQKKWNVGNRAENPDAVREISEKLGIEYITALLLYTRGYRTAEEARGFIELESELFHDPFLLPDMKEGCDRIISAIDSGEKTVIYGDYDVDGVTSVSLLYLYLKSRGGNVCYYIPNRAGEGYGVNNEAIKKLFDDGARLFITVDTGITAVKEAEYVRSIGGDIIVTDHHECHGELPDAAAVINPKRADSEYPFSELAGVGVAFKLVTALELLLCERYGRSREKVLPYICREYIDLAALGTVADVMPLRDENRLIVSMGLKYMEAHPRPGLAALWDAADGGKSKHSRKATSTLIGFVLAPRINAAGRISSAVKAVELFVTDSSERAAGIAEELCETNRQRQAEENKIIEQIRAEVGDNPDTVSEKVIVLDDDRWHHGVIGIVSSRITEKYNRPSILVSFDGEIGKGSGRSIKGMNLVDALTYCSDLLVKYGGHELAAGLSLRRDKLEEFKRRINEYADAHLTDGDLVTNVDIDCELLPSEVTLKQAEELSVLEPFGVSNPVPVFMMSDMKIVETVGIGSNRHTKIILEKDGKRFSAVYFGISPDGLGYISGNTVDAVFNLNVNEYMGNRSEQLQIRDLRPAKDFEKEIEKGYADYRNAVENGVCSAEDLPKREHFVSVYLRLKRPLPADQADICMNRLLGELNGMPGQNRKLSYAKLRLTLDILSESGVITVTQKDFGTPGFERFTAEINNLENKVNLERSCLYKQLTETAKTNTPE